MPNKLLPMIVGSVLSSVGWALGAKIGPMTGYMASMVGFGLGLYWGRRMMYKFFD